MAPSSEDLIVYTAKFSPYALRVIVALKEKDIPYKAIFVNLADKPKELLEANPAWGGKVPAISHRGGSLAESTVILQYLEDAFPEKVALMPEDAVGRAKVRFWADYAYKGIDWIKSGILSKPGSPQKKEGIENALNFFKNLEGAMTKYSADGPFFTGEKFGLVDVVLSPLTAWIQIIDVALLTMPGPKDIPRVYKWVQATAARKSVSDTLPTNEEFVEFASTLITKLAAGKLPYQA